VVLTATATELRFSGTARSVTTPVGTVVHIDKDSEPPLIKVLSPAEVGATATERREVKHLAEVTDNVKVSTVEVSLFADKDRDGSFGPSELLDRSLMVTGPFGGSFPLKAFADYGVPKEQANLALHLEWSAKDGAGNESRAARNVNLVRNEPPQVTQIALLDARGFNLGNISELTEGRQVLVNVSATDREVGVESSRLFAALGQSPVDTEFQLVGEDRAAPFQFNYSVPRGHVGERVNLRASAVDVDGFTSDLSSPRSLTIKPDLPPVASIVKPSNDESVIIDGQDLEIFVDARDDLGPEGMDRVVFYVNDAPLATAYDSYGKISGSAAQENIFRAVIHPPQGAQGFVIHAVAFDKLGQSTKTAPVRVGKVEDTVKPDLDVLVPAAGEVLTVGAELHAHAQVRDIGVASERSVKMTLRREYQPERCGQGNSCIVGQCVSGLCRSDCDPAAGGCTGVSEGQWLPLATSEVELVEDGAGSDLNNHLYSYRFDIIDSQAGVLKRTGAHNERVATQTRCVTKRHTVESTTYHEVGMSISKRTLLSPSGDLDLSVSRQPYYGAIDQFRGASHTGAMVAA